MSRGPGALALAFGALGCASPRPAAHLRQRRYGLIHPLLDSDCAASYRELRPFRHRLDRLVREALGQGRASHVSVYFRDLSNGPWFGIGEREPFTPASLLKVPILMAVLKQAESAPELLRREVRADAAALQGMPALAPNLSPAEAVRPGGTYTVEELLRLMIVHSDNRAKNLLLRQIPAQAMDDLFADVGLLVPAVRSPEDYMSVKEYATLFRVLYNASYLNKAMSQKALELLTRTGFRDGLVAGAPAGTPVAHKYGERSGGEDAPRQLHDCGIVYHPRSPYLVCVMTRGRDFRALAGVIRDVSARIHAEVDAQASESPAVVPSK